jgi:uncharacterized SAM-binding protein YcdF (DUF218 family)
MSCPRLLRALGVIGVALFFVSAFTPVPNLLDNWTGVPAQLEPAAAIVVLGGRVYTNGALSESSLRRALLGMMLYRRGLAPLLVFSGPANKEGFVEAEIRAEMARQLGIPPTAILTESTAQTTREEAARMAALLQPVGVHAILLVTDRQHMARSQPLFQNRGFTVHPAPVDDLSEADTPQGRLQLISRVSQELFARLYYRLAGYL